MPASASASASVRFDRLLSAWRAASEAYRAISADLYSVYGPVSSSYAYTSSDRARLDRASDKLDKARSAFYAYLRTIQTRNWESGVATAWVMDNLTFAMATTTDLLVDRPSPSYGTPESVIVAFMPPTAI